MRKATRLGWAGASLLGLLLVLAIACEDSAVIAPSDGSITVSLNPTVVTVDPSNPAEAEKSADVRAILMNKDGVPVENALVFFSSTGGRLVEPGSNPEVRIDSATTDSQGIARATLIVNGDDPDEVEVTALSGALNSTATLTKGVVGEQRPPSANFTIEPCGNPCTGDINRSVTFTSTSTDPNAADVLTFRWTLDSSLSGPQTLAPTRSTRLSRSFSAAQDLHVTLEVSDDPAALTTPDAPGIWDDSLTKDYKICNNRAPVADAQATVGSTRSVPVDASGSTDADGDPLTFAWQCGNGTTASGESAVCNYAAAGTFTITLTVTDTPDGCASKTDTDTTVVTVP